MFRLLPTATFPNISQLKAMPNAMLAKLLPAALQGGRTLCSRPAFVSSIATRNTGVIPARRQYHEKDMFISSKGLCSSGAVDCMTLQIFRVVLVLKLNHGFGFS